MNSLSSNRAAALWVLTCAWFTAAGWILSGLGQLNRGGYVAATAVGIAVLVIGQTFLPKREVPGQRVMAAGGSGSAKGFAAGIGRGLTSAATRLRKRFRKPLPMAFAVLTGLAILGGMLHPPNNYDGLAYRVPRVLHWLAEGQWHWIHTDFPRVNTRSVGMEWVSAPLMALTGTDRALFVINAISFLLLPGLTFSLLTRLGVRSRVAWHWMWILPSGYCFLMQAGSIGNDLFGAVLVLMAMDSALRARVSGRWWEFAISALAAALMTSAKVSNLPLALPWLVAVLPSLRLCFRRPLSTAAVIVVCVGVSFLPTAVMNVKHCGDWTGLKAEPARFSGGSPLLHVANNAVLLSLQNLVPPVFPLSARWNALMDHVQPAALRTQLEQSFENVGAKWRLDEMQTEERAGLGVGVSGLVILSLVCGLGCRLRPTSAGRLTGHQRWIHCAIWTALLVYMAKSGLSAAARIAAPYYIPAVAVVLIPGFQTECVRRRVWRWAVALVVGLGVVLVSVSPSRPLWPALSVLRTLGASESQHPLLRRAWRVYSVYAERWDAFGPARKHWPPGVTRLGLVTFDDPEASLWRPFGSREIVHVTRADTAREVAAAGLEYILVAPGRFEEGSAEDFAAWLGRLQGVVVAECDLELRASKGVEQWKLVRINPQ